MGTAHPHEPTRGQQLHNHSLPPFSLLKGMTTQSLYHHGDGQEATNEERKWRGAFISPGAGQIAPLQEQGGSATTKSDREREVPFPRKSQAAECPTPEG